LSTPIVKRLGDPSYEREATMKRVLILAGTILLIVALWKPMMGLVSMLTGGG
jgi:hypothetical protein